MSSGQEMSNQASLQPPMQTIPGEVLYDTLDSNAIPRYRFGVARIDEDGQVEIIESIPVPDRRPPIEEVGEAYTENVIQTYAVQVPYTDLVDGVEVTKMRTEHRTRTVPINRVRPKPGCEDKWETRTYTVSVPYTERVGETVVRRARLETRTRLAHVDEPESKYVPKEVVSVQPIDSAQCYSMSATRLSGEEIETALQQSIPIIVVNHVDFITPFFESILKPGTLFFVL